MIALDHMFRTTKIYRVWAAVRLKSAQTVSDRMDIHFQSFRSIWWIPCMCMTNNHILLPTDHIGQRLSSAWLWLGLSQSLSLASRDSYQDLPHSILHHCLSLIHFIIAYCWSKLSLLIFSTLLWRSNIKAKSKIQAPPDSKHELSWHP